MTQLEKMPPRTTLGPRTCIAERAREKEVAKVRLEHALRGPSGGGRGHRHVRLHTLPGDTDKDAAFLRRAGCGSSTRRRTG